MLALAPAWDWPRLRSLVLDAVSSPHSKRAYALALGVFRSPPPFWPPLRARQLAHTRRKNGSATVLRPRRAGVRPKQAGSFGKFR